jgi:hypothetical protein
VVTGHSLIKEVVRVTLDGGTVVELPLDQIQPVDDRRRR